MQYKAKIEGEVWEVGDMVTVEHLYRSRGLPGEGYEKEKLWITEKEKKIVGFSLRDRRPSPGRIYVFLNSPSEGLGMLAFDPRDLSLVRKDNNNAVCTIKVKPMV